MDSTKLLLVSLFLILYMIWDQWQIDYVLRKPDTVATTTQSGLGAETALEPKRSESDLVRVKTDVLDLDINLDGAVIDGLRLLKYPTAVSAPNDPTVLLTTKPGAIFLNQSGFRGSKPAPDHKTRYTAEQQQLELPDGAASVDAKLSWRSPEGVEFTKIYSFHRGSYEVGLRYEIVNGGAETWTGRMYGQLLRSFVDDRSSMVRTYTGAAISSDEKRYEKISFDDMRGQPVARDIKGGWAAMVQHYFFAAMIPPVDQPYHYYSLSTANNEFAIGLYGPEVVVAPGSKGQSSMRLYVGPKEQKRLEAIAPGLELTADYGALWFLAKPIFKVLSLFHSLTKNWGIAIILVTLSLKLLFFRLSAAQYKSMAKMRRLQPRLQALRERFADDKQRLNQAMMEMYREERINPLGGCLPILIQIPVFISLYWVLLESVELRQAGFFLWLKDLSIPDPYFVLPLLMGISMYIQQKLSPSTMDPMQQKVLQALPVIFTITFAMFASGLVLYWVVNNVLSILQQWYITKKYGDLDKPLPTASTG